MQYSSIAEGHDIRTYLVRLDPDEEIIAWLSWFADDRRIDSGFVSALGTVHDAVLGYFDRATGQYLKRTVEADCEITALFGTLALKEGKPSAHVHVTLGTREFQAIAGHLFQGKVAATCELVIRQLPGIAQRKKDEKSGLWLLDV